jgi:excisionase family DNA binding protein
MRIKELAETVGVSADWVRKLEREGRIPRAARDHNGHRRFDEEDARRLRKGLLQRGTMSGKVQAKEEDTP